jgi:hypothetical protein
LRLPFLFQEFDVESERTSLRILKGLGRFEGREDISAETITSVVLNDGLRARLRSENAVNGEEEIALIRDALLEEMKARAAADANRAQQLQATVEQQEAALGELDARERAKDAEVKRLSTRVAAEESRAKAADERLTAQGLEVAQLKATLGRMEDRKRQRLALFGYFGLLILVILGAGVAAWQADRLLPDGARMIGSMPMKALAAIVFFVAGHLLLEWGANGSERMKRLWPFEQVRRFRIWLWGLVIIGFVVGVCGSLYANWIQKRIDQDPVASSNSRLGPSSATAPVSEGIPEPK